MVEQLGAGLAAVVKTSVFFWELGRIDMLTIRAQKSQHEAGCLNSWAGGQSNICWLHKKIKIDDHLHSSQPVCTTYLTTRSVINSFAINATHLGARTAVEAFTVDSTNLIARGVVDALAINTPELATRPVIDGRPINSTNLMARAVVIPLAIYSTNLPSAAVVHALSVSG
ncbi:MAG: hypothetical protein NTY26_16890 [Burkholderiales bacterium]|nr:hypothetical protein [Burkholderiales bacterium]